MRLGLTWRPMRGNRKTSDLCRVAALPLVILVSAGCRDEPGPIRIGAAGGFAGVPDNLRGIQLAIAEANQAGGLDGRAFELVIGDDSGTGDEAARVAERLVNDKSILAVVGHASTTAMMAAARVYDGHLAAVATLASSPELSNISPWVFRVAPSDSTRGTDLARLFVSRGWRRVAVLYQNRQYGRGLAVALQASLETMGGEMVSSDPILDASRDFDVFLRTYARTRPDAVLVINNSASAQAFVHQAAEHRLSARIVGADGWSGRLASDPVANGIYMFSTFLPDDARPAAKAFRERFRTRYGYDPDALAALGYDAALAVVAALRKGGRSREGVRDALASLRRAPIQGATGLISFASGDRVERVGGMLRIVDGRLITDARWVDVAKRP